MMTRQEKRLQWKQLWKTESFEGETRAERRRAWRDKWEEFVDNKVEDTDE